MSALDPTAGDLQALKKKARDGRRAFAAGSSRFVKTLQGTMDLYRQARADGVSREDAARGIEEVLRAEWPCRPTKFPTCEDCDRSGWATVVCEDGARCERQNCHKKGTGWAHLYVVPCVCVDGDKQRQRVVRVADELAGLGRSKRKPRGFSRMGQ